LHGRWAHNCGPVAFAVVFVPKGDDEAKLVNLFVHDRLRRRGLATRLVLAIAERWPKLTGTATPEATGFYDKLVARGLAQCDGKRRYTSTPDCG
jgi:GNAT superfamily N-acetyltransferase